LVIFVPLPSARFGRSGHGTSVIGRIGYVSHPPPA